MTDLEIKTKKENFIKVCWKAAGLPGVCSINVNCGCDGYRYFHIKDKEGQLHVLWDTCMDARLLSLADPAHGFGAWYVSKVVSFIELLNEGE